MGIMIIDNPYFTQLADDDIEEYKLVSWPRRAGKSTYIASNIIDSLLKGKNILVISPYCHKDVVLFNVNRIIEEEFFLKRNFLFYSGNKNEIIHREHKAEIYRAKDLLPIGICGKKYDKILIDEGAYIDNKLYKSIEYFINNIPTEIFFTPKIYNKKDKPYIKELWDNDPKWEHYHMNYKWLPEADNIKKYKSDYTWEQWRTDILAEWVEKE
jgi:hypothetical protein